MTTPDTGRTLSIERIETFTHALRLNDLGNSPRAQVPPIEEFEPRERDVVRKAIDGTYETSDLPEWLVQFLSGTPFVSVDGEYYRLHATLPSTTITANAVPEDEVDGAIASYETYEEAVTHDGLVRSGLMRTARQEGVTLTAVWPDLKNFLETYDAVDYRGRVLDFSVAVDDPGAPYTVTAERESLEAVADGSVWNASEASTSVRELIREAGTTEGIFPLSDPPRSLIENLDTHDYVYLDGTFYTTYIEKRGSRPVSMTAEFTDATLDDDFARIRLALQNESDHQLTVFSGAPPPFGVLSFHALDDTDMDTGYILWSDAYTESGHVHTEGHEVVAVNSIGINTPVEAGESVERRFTIEQTELSPGEYVISDNVGISSENDDGGTFPYRVIFRLEDPD